VLSLSPHTAMILWMALAFAIYCFFVVQLLRSDPRTLWTWDGLAFVLYSMLEPYAVKSGLISLGPAALTATCLFTLGTRKERNLPERAQRLASIANGLFLAACAISFAQAILQYKSWQRYLLSFGLDFWGEVLLLGAFFIWIRWTGLAEGDPPCSLTARMETTVYRTYAGTGLPHSANAHSPWQQTGTELKHHS